MRTEYIHLTSFTEVTKNLTEAITDLAEIVDVETLGFGSVTQTSQKQSTKKADSNGQ